MKPSIIFISILLAGFFLGYFYFTTLSPTFVAKPEIEKPSEITIEDSHVSYLLNEIGAYKLHDNPFTGEPAIIEVIIDDKSTKFKIINSEFVKTDEKQDISIYLSENSIRQAIEGDAELELLNLYEEDKIHIETFSDEKTLMLKGYKVIYDMFTSNQITGNVAVSITNGFNLVFLILAVALINIIKEKI